MKQLKWNPTGTKGIRYRQHPTRKHGKKFDIYYAKSIPDPDQRDYEVSYKKIRKMGFETEISFERGVDEMVHGLQYLDIVNPYLNV